MMLFQALPFSSPRPDGHADSACADAERGVHQRHSTARGTGPRVT